MTGIGGVGSVAQVQNVLATTDLSAFNIVLPVDVTSRLQSWATRQKVNYASIVSLIAADFLSIKDWENQIQLYSAANAVQLSGPHTAISSLVKLNTLFKASSLVPDATLGLSVGLFLETLEAFSTVFSAQPELIQNAASLSDSLGVS
jgi:hypothetical protein